MKNKMVLIIGGGVMIGLIAWYTLTGDAIPAGVIQTQRVEQGKVSDEQRAILDTLFQLRAIQLTGTIFNNPAFTSLKDFRTEIVAEPIGRRNPFAPLEQVVPATPATTQTGR
ncbi:hypothetical protein HY413_01100 [Candidatus Kaiserbacteria bacterium]|nr:hypothetical protein [Candidatus Kaiserbacteria bacterium]